MSDPTKDLCLLEELELSHRLLIAGLGNLQEIDMENDFYHLPHQLLASGLERLTKCYICLVYEARNGNYPTFRFVKQLGHDLTSLKDTIVSDFYSTNSRPILQTELDFITSNTDLQKAIHVLSEFGKFACYYNLDVVTGNQNLPIDPTHEWAALENSIEDITPYLGEENIEALHRDYYPRVHAKIIAKLERFVRAIAFQFTLGNHGGKLQQYSVTYTSFRNLRDEELGKTDYRRSVQILKQDEHKWVRRSSEELAASPWPNQQILKSEFTRDWPFRADEVTIECRDSMIFVINIGGFDFALNGIAAGHLKLPFPHEAGEAILGKSVGPFIDLARELDNQQGA